MKTQHVSVIREKSGWCVRWNGVNVVTFDGPHAEEWALREREELVALLNISAPVEVFEHRDGTYARASRHGA
jgi:hypothetical protein